MKMKRNEYLLALVLALCLGGCVQKTDAPDEPTQITVPETTVHYEETVPQVLAEPTEASEIILPQAEQIEGRLILEGVDQWASLTDGNYGTKAAIKPGQAMLLESEEKIGGIYLQWDAPPGEYTLQWEGGSLDCGKENFLHEYVVLPQSVERLELFAEQGVSVCELVLFTEGVPPDTVQQWLPPCGQADVLVFPTHSDDDALFFGALIAHCAIERELTVQTAFMVDHWYEPVRNHERLNGLWEMGVRHYPILGTARDYNAPSLTHAENYHRADDILGWQVEQLRRFQPLVVVGHDLNGEYGHKQHILNARYLTQAAELAAQADQYPQSAQCYGVWDIPKLYLHLYGDDPLVLEVNTPLAKDEQGRTAFQIAQDAYSHHKSQQQYYFQVRQGSEYPREDCTRFGLLRSAVGADTGWDIMEHTGR
jgi:LmbE family N-acetylglucosaminyl deacetylase